MSSHVTNILIKVSIHQEAELLIFLGFQPCKKCIFLVFWNGKNFHELLGIGEHHRINTLNLNFRRFVFNDYDFFFSKVWSFLHLFFFFNLEVWRVVNLSFKIRNVGLWFFFWKVLFFLHHGLKVFHVLHSLFKEIIHKLLEVLIRLLLK